MRARRDAELAVDATEIGLDRLRADEHPGGDALVRQAIGRELRDLSFGRSQGCRRLSRRDPLQFGASPLGPELGADVLEDAERRRERLLRESLPLRTSVDLPENEQCACALEWHRATFVFRECALEHGRRALRVAVRCRENPAATSRSS